MHAPGHIINPIIDLIESLVEDEMTLQSGDQINSKKLYDYSDFSINDKEKLKQLYVLLGKVWNCIDIVPRSTREYAIEIHRLKSHDDETISKIEQGCTYGQIARVLRPVIKELLEK